MLEFPWKQKVVQVYQCLGRQQIPLKIEKAIELSNKKTIKSSCCFRGLSRVCGSMNLLTLTYRFFREFSVDLSLISFSFRKYQRWNFNWKRLETFAGKGFFRGILGCWYLNFLYKKKNRRWKILMYVWNTPDWNLFLEWSWGSMLF